MNDERETLEQRIERAADEARRAWLSTEVAAAPWAAVCDADKVDWRNVARPSVERIAELEAAAARANEGGNQEIEKLNREIAFLRADLTATRNAGAGYADEAVILRDENKALRAEVERLKEDQRAYRDTIKTLKDAAVISANKADDYIEKLRADVVAATKRGDDAEGEITDLRTTVRVIVGMIAPRGQS